MEQIMLLWKMLCEITNVLWEIPLMALMVGVGIYFTLRTGLFQIRGIPFWWKRTLGEIFKGDTDDSREGELKPFQALSAVLAGTIGGGTISGVAAAIAVGGPGSVFWMWLIAIVGMMTKMVEVTLAVHFRKKGSNGEFYGGPMYYMRQGLGHRGQVIAGIYAVALLILVLTDACFVQPNTLAACVNDVFAVPLFISGVVVVLIALAVILSGGIQKIGSFCGKMVPPMVLIYLLASLVVVVMNLGSVPAVFAEIIHYAFVPAPALGGFVGASVQLAMARGASRGIFTNEAGMGTAATVHAMAQTDHPIHQGLYGIFEVFVTFIICTLTSLSILCSGVWNNGNTGVVLTFDAFRSVWGYFGIVILCVAVVLFTFSSYLGFYVEFRTCVAYLFGEKAEKWLRWLYFILPILSVTMEVEMVWDLADMAVGFIVIPNMIALLLLSPTFFRLYHEYMGKEN